MTKDRKHKNFKRRQFWQNHIEQWAASGTSQVDYCRQNRLRSNRFTYWKIKFKREQQSSELVPVPTSVLSLLEQAKQAPVSELRLSVDSRYELVIPDGFSGTCLEAVLRIVDKVSCYRFQ